MPTKKSQPSVWRFHHLRSGNERTACLFAYWEVSGDPISDDYTPHEISPTDLFSRWARKVREGPHPNGLLPVSWSIRGGEGDGIFEFMPFQFDHYQLAKEENFLSFFSWPTNSKTGEPLNWMQLPVVDKLWRPTRADKGGFIQEATSWKPSNLQPYVYLDSLEKAVPS